VEILRRLAGGTRVLMVSAALTCPLILKAIDLCRSPPQEHGPDLYPAARGFVGIGASSRLSLPTQDGAVNLNVRTATDGRRLVSMRAIGRYSWAPRTGRHFGFADLVQP
jgi:hypothetical protein